MLLLPSVKETVSPATDWFLTVEVRVAESAAVVEEPVIDGAFETAPREVPA